MVGTNVGALGVSSLTLICVCVCVLNLPYFAQVGSLLRIMWFPTMISRDRALVTATLNLCRGEDPCMKDKTQEMI